MCAVKVEFQVEVKAKAERLWDILTDVKSWPEWQGTSYIKPIPTSPVNEGATFEVELGGLRWNLTVTEAERPRKVCWTGRRMGMQAIHEWEFIEMEGKTKTVNRESVSGWMLSLLHPIARIKVSKANEKCLADLKARAENL